MREKERVCVCRNVLFVERERELGRLEGAGPQFATHSW